MALNYRLTDTAADCGLIAACSGATVQAGGGRKANGGGTPGTVEVTANVLAGTTRAVFAIEVTPEEGVNWNAGDCEVRLNVTTGHMDLLIRAIHICRVNSSCVSQETLGSETGLSLITTGGVSIDRTIPISAVASPEAGDKLYVVMVVENTNSMNDRTIGVTPDGEIDTPWTNGASEPEPVSFDFDHHAELLYTGATDHTAHAELGEGLPDYVFSDAVFGAALDSGVSHDFDAHAELLAGTETDREAPAELLHAVHAEAAHPGELLAIHQRDDEQATELLEASAVQSDHHAELLSGAASDHGAQAELGAGVHEYVFSEGVYGAALDGGVSFEFDAEAELLAAQATEPESPAELLAEHSQAAPSPAELLSGAEGTQEAPSELLAGAQADHEAHAELGAGTQDYVFSNGVFGPALDGSVSVDFDAHAELLPGLPVPTGLVATIVGPGAVDFHFTDNSGGELAHILYGSRNGGTPTWIADFPAGTAPTSENPYEDREIESGTWVYWVVSTDGMFESAPSNEEEVVLADVDTYEFTHHGELLAAQETDADHPSEALAGNQTDADAGSELLAGQEQDQDASGELLQGTEVDAVHHSELMAAPGVVSFDFAHSAELLAGQATDADHPSEVLAAHETEDAAGSELLEAHQQDHAAQAELLRRIEVDAVSHSELQASPGVVSFEFTHHAELKASSRTDHTGDAELLVRITPAEAIQHSELLARRAFEALVHSEMGGLSPIRGAIRGDQGLQPLLIGSQRIQPLLVGDPATQPDK